MPFLLEAPANVIVVYGVAWGGRVLKNGMMGSGVPSIVRSGTHARAA